MSRAILHGHSRERDARSAVAELHGQIVRPDTELVLFFCSSHYDRDELASALAATMLGCTVIGCTTAGEIGPAGCQDASLVGVGFPSGAVTVACGLLPDLDQFRPDAAAALVQALMQRLEARVLLPSLSGLFALQLIDGLSRREEVVSHALQQALGDVPLIGGSASDDMAFHEAFVYCDGAFATNAAVVALVHTTLPFTTFKIDHYEPVGERMVVTDADETHRRVRELNGVPALEEYGRVTGVDAARLAAPFFATNPVVVQVDGVPYVRSVIRTDDDSLVFACAIDEGIVLRVARGDDPVRGMQEALAAIEARIGAPQLVVGCECIMRRLQVARLRLAGPVEALQKRMRVVGFYTYGEQFCGLHVNQTFVGIAFGAGGDGAHG